jgi:hypothetical protein
MSGLSIGEAKVESRLLELVVLSASLAVCLWAWESGGLLGLVGCVAGAGVGSKGRDRLNNALAGLWVGLMLGGMVGGGLSQLTNFATQ